MSTITKKEIESAREKLKNSYMDRQKSDALIHALTRADAWMRSAKEIRESSTEEVEAALQTVLAWDGLVSSRFRGLRPEDMETAHEMRVKWKQSSMLRQYEPKAIQEASETIERWLKDSHLKTFSPTDLLELYKAFDGKSPRDLAKGDTLEKQVKKSFTLRHKPPRELQKSLDFYTYWYDKKEWIKIRLPRIWFRLTGSIANGKRFFDLKARTSSKKRSTSCRHLKNISS